jgi:multimeric flavodoxin WrbA
VASADPRKGMPTTKIDEQTFRARFDALFYDPAFGPLRAEIDAAAKIAWEAFDQGRKAPRTEKAGPGFADPSYDLSIEWLESKRSIERAEEEHKDADRPSRILLINASPRNEHTCPGEMSKTFRLVEAAKSVIGGQANFICDELDLSRLTAEYGRYIHPCKGCFSTSPALCHWPCSCYPNHSLGQVNDWMADIYPRWVAAHGIMIITPCHWYQAPTVLKAMMDRLVCADGGNPDPTATHGKDVRRAKELELQGWKYPRHLEARAFAIIVHGDTEGIDVLRRSLHDWLSDMQLVPAGRLASIDRYVGYYRPYATSHEDLDADQSLFDETANAALTLVEAVKRYRNGEREPGADLTDPRPK